MTDTMYDPANHTVAEVREHLTGLPADEVAAIKALEADGSDRAGISSWEPTAKPTVPKDGSDGYDRVPVEDPYPAGTPAAWGHGGLNEDQAGTETPVEIV